MAFLNWTNDATRAAYEVVSEHTEDAGQDRFVRTALRDAASLADLALLLGRHVTRLLVGDEPGPEFGCRTNWANRVSDWTLVNWTEVAMRVWLARATRESAPMWPVH